MVDREPRVDCDASKQDVPGVELCRLHPKRAVIGNCDVCGKPVCMECIEGLASDSGMFCSAACRAESKKPSPETQQRVMGLLQGAATPVTTGLRLWLGSMVHVLAFVSPIVFVMTLLLMFGGATLDPLAPAGKFPEPSFEISIALFLSFLFGMGTISALLTRKYTAIISANPYLVAALRFVPWVVTYGIVVVLVVFGSFFFILPGVFLSVRLFWADEFAMAHGCWPIRAMRDSWNLAEANPGILSFGLRAGFATQLCVAVIGLLFWVWITIIGFLGLTGTALGLGAQIFGFILGVFLVYAAFHSMQLAFFYGCWALDSDTARLAEEDEA